MGKTISDVPGYVYFKDERGAYVDANPAFLELCQLKTIGGKTDKELWPLEAEVLKRHDERAISQDTPFTIEESFTLPNQEKKTFLTIRTPWKNAQGRLLGIRAHLTDITTLRQTNAQEDARQKARQSIAANIEDIIICTPGSIYWKDLNGVYLGCNDYMVREAGLESRSDIVGKTDKELWADQAEKIRANDLLVLQSGKPISMEEFVEGRVFFSVKMPLTDEDGGIIGIICNSHDITYLKEIESALREAKEQSEMANRAKSEFLATVSHELRSPLTSILGMIHFLNTPKQLSPEQRKLYLNNVSVSAKHLLSLVDDFLDFAKLEAGKFELIVSPIDLKSLVLETTTILMPQASSKKLEIIVDYDNSIPHLILGDSRAIRQIIINLLGNAIKFTHKGSITVQIKSLEQSDKMVKLSLSITDTGIGIPKDKLEVIFDYFQQADYSYRRRYGGTGLGLSITNKLVTAMDGTIEVSSKENEGSTFKCTISFPLQDKALVQNPWTLHQATVPVLIVSDNPRGEVLRKQIETSNSRVTTSNDALNIFVVSQETATPFEIVIIDDELYSLSPQALSQKIIDCSTLRKPMLLLLSSTPSLKVKREAEHSGFFETIVKPVQPVEFQTILTASWEKWVEQRSYQLQNTIEPDVANSAPQLSVVMNTLDKEDREYNKRVLLVDDEQMVQFIHSEFLSDLNCLVDTANNAEEALNLLNENQQYDLMFADMGMPGISGIDLVKSYRQLEKSNDRQHMPIIALTSYSSQKDKQNFIDAGVDKVLVKPVTPDQLQSVLEEFD